MSKTVTIELPDEVYEALEKLSKQHRKPIEVLALEWVSKYSPKPPHDMTEAQRRAACDRLLRWGGAQGGLSSWP
jgi:predicted transcriptional regulator